MIGRLLCRLGMHGRSQWRLVTNDLADGWVYECPRCGRRWYL